MATDAPHGRVGGRADCGETPQVIAAQWDRANVDERQSMLTHAWGQSTRYADRFQHTGQRVFDRDRLRVVRPDGVVAIPRPAR